MFEDSNSIYKRLDGIESDLWKKMEVQLFRINGLDLPFSPKWKKIAVNLSGGADSACLTYLLSKIITENKFDCKIDVITHVRCWNTRPWQGPISIKVFDKLKLLFPEIINERHENFIAPELEHAISGFLFPDLVNTGMMRSGDQVSVGQYNQYCIHRFNLDAVFNATTMNPDVDFPKKMPDREKTAEDGVCRDLMVRYYDSFMFKPFTFVDKTWVMAQYHLFNLNELLESTRSCEGDVTASKIRMIFSNHQEYKPGRIVPLCDSCFWCLERKWASDKLSETLEKLKDV